MAIQSCICACFSSDRSRFPDCTRVLVPVRGCWGPCHMSGCLHVWTMDTAGYSHCPGLTHPGLGTLGLAGCSLSTHIIIEKA